MVKAIRGAITVAENDAEEIIEMTGLLLTKITEENDVCEEDIISIIFTVTKDLDAAFPAAAARKLAGQVRFFCV